MGLKINNLVIKSEEKVEKPSPKPFDEMRLQAVARIEKKKEQSVEDVTIVGELGIIEYKKSSFLNDMLQENKE